ncbi:YchE family NAAT transporter [Gallaecimonas kandeliae]|nr:YchE family NAAT transporter [Gallaecimonas kandeliae]WKE67453.1 YchE family NAAT transporter [Gallaecimonas kandeliae]
MDYAIYTQFFVAMLAIVNPFGLLPIFIGLTSDQSQQERRRTALMASFASAVILWVVLLLGESLLHFFSISVSSFQVAGGVLLSFTALSMLQGKLGETRRTTEEGREAAGMDSVILVPLALPLIAGPAAITTVIVFTQAHHSLVDKGALGIAIALLALVTWAVFLCAPVLARWLGTTGINLITRVMGLIMMALAVEFMAKGVKGLFPVLCG